MNKKMIGVSIPCYNEEDNVVDISKQLIQLFESELPDYDYNIQFIDNHSTDKTRTLLRFLCAEYPQVRAIFNARNFPKTSGYYGITNCEGDCVISIPCDFQVSLQLIPKMIREWENGAKIVCLIRNSSEEHRSMWNVRQLYYYFYRKFSETEVLQNFSGNGLYDKTFLDICRKINDPIVSFFQEITELGYNIVKIYYKHKKRKRGKSKHNLLSLIDFAIFRFTNASSIAPHIATVGGFLMGIICFIISLIYVILKLLLWNQFSAGMAPILIGVFFIGALELFFTGLIGEYVVKANTRLMNYPLVVEEERLNFHSMSEENLDAGLNGYKTDTTL